MRFFLVSAFMLFTAFSHGAHGQLKHTKYFSSQNGFCSQTIILDSSGYFFKEWGCEGRSNISFGRYKVKRDNGLIFQFLPFDSLVPVGEVVRAKTADDDSLVTITFYDRYREPLRSNFGVRVADTGNTVHEMWTDEAGQIQVNRFLFRNVVLNQFLTIYGEIGGIDIGKESLFVYLNLPRLFLEYPELKLDKPKAMDLQLRQDGLYNPKMKAIIYKPD
jgi:hypothetical protein